MSEPTFGLRLESDGQYLHTGSTTNRIIEIQLTAPALREKSTRAPINLALVIDRSGSMYGAKLDYAKKAAVYALDLLDENDRVALIAYDHTVNTMSPCVPVNERNRRNLKSAVMELFTGGNTNLSGGWLRGCQLIGEVLDSASIQRCMLLTDGMANHGITGVEELSVHAEEIFKRGVSTSTFGLGDQYDERLLEVMANHGGGRYYYIASPQDIPTIFEQELEGLTRITARRVRIHIDVPAGVRAKVLGDWQTFATGQGLDVELHHLTAEQQISVYLQVEFPPQPEGTKIMMGVSVHAEGENAIQLESRAEVDFEYATDETLRAETPNLALVKRAKKIEAAIEAEKALKMEKEGRRQEGSQHLKDFLRSAAPMMDDADVKDLELTADRIQNGMDPMEQKMRHMQNYTIRRSREIQWDRMQETEREIEKKKRDGNQS